MQKKHIAFVINTLSNGGAERLASNLSLRLSERYDIDLIVNDLQHLDYPYRGRVISLNMPADRDRMQTAYQLRTLITRTRILRRIRRKDAYHAVVSFSDMSNLANVLSRSGRDRTIISYHCAIRESMNNKLKCRAVGRALLSFCLWRADRTVCVSKGIEEELRERYGLPSGTSSVICNGVDVERIQRMSQAPLPAWWETAADRACRIIVTVGRLEAQKGQAHLIRAVGKLRDDGWNVKLVIFGEGKLRPDLESLVSRLELNHEVIFAGFTENPYPSLAHADVFVMPSQYEGFSCAVVEALACGVPCVSTDYFAGAREIFAPDTDRRDNNSDRIEKAAYGILVPVCENDTADERTSCTEKEMLMAEGIREILTDRELAEHYRTMAVKRARELDVSFTCNQWMDVIEGRAAERGAS